MSRNTYIVSSLLLALTALGGCSSSPPDSATKKAAIPLERIQGKIEVVPSTGGATDSALNSGGPAVFLWEGKHRYRLFFRKPAAVIAGIEYIVEGINAQKVIDEIGDPDQGKNGYPLTSSCERVVKMAWGSMSFEEFDLKTATLRTRAARYPARPIILVVHIQPVPPDHQQKAAAAEEKDLPIGAVPAEKQKALLIEAPPVQAAPLWEPKGGAVSCKVIINGDGTISELETGVQLCEIVPWPRYRYKPMLKGGHPVKVRTEVEVSFEPRK